MRAEYWVLVALALTIAEILAPGTFLIFFAVGALMTAALSLAVASLPAQLGVFVVATMVALLAGSSLYRHLLGKRAASRLGQGPIGEPGIVEEAIVNGRGKVRVRDIAWLATGSDLPVGTPIVVTGRRGGTLLEVAARRHEPAAALGGSARGHAPN
ncbi:MAG TPA: NfeD family protein [Stellaceae bacterium]|nr:NfeD family protein [Stellaceae bacterium]